MSFSALLRAEIPKIERTFSHIRNRASLSVLFYEPKFPKCARCRLKDGAGQSFSALLRAEIPKMVVVENAAGIGAVTFSALLRAEIPKIWQGNVK